MAGRNTGSIPLSSSSPSVLLSAIAEVGGGKADHASCSTGPLGTTGPPRSYHLPLPFQKAQDSLQKQTRLLLNRNSSVKTPSSGLISLSQRTFLFLGRVKSPCVRGLLSFPLEHQCLRHALSNPPVPLPSLSPPHCVSVPVRMVLSSSFLSGVQSACLGTR